MDICRVGSWRWTSRIRWLARQPSNLDESGLLAGRTPRPGRRALGFDLVDRLIDELPTQLLTAGGHCFAPVPVGQESEIADPYKTGRQHVQGKSTQKLHSRQPFRFPLGFRGPLFVAERDVIVFERNEP